MMLSHLKKMFKIEKNISSRSKITTALDIGSSKVCCLISERDSQGVINIIGVGRHASAGVKAGVVVDMQAAENSIINAVHTAEKMAGITARNIFVNINGPYLQSKNIMGEIPIRGHAIDEADVRRVIAAAKNNQIKTTDQLLQAYPTMYTIDGAKGIRDPRGMFGEKLGVNVHFIYGNKGPIYNLVNCVARAHLEINGMIVSSYASGMATTVADEIELGVTVIDMGGGTTSLSLFYEGQMHGTHVVPLGGHHITNDIARVFSCSLTNAERAKVLYGSAISSMADDREMIMIPQVGEGKSEAGNQLSRAALVSVIKPRVEEIFEHVKQKLLESEFSHVMGRRVILTGGASQLTGVREIAAQILERNVRIGKPLYIGPGDLSYDSSLATCAGLLSAAYSDQKKHNKKKSFSDPEKAIQRMTSWLKEIW